jgi:hypothetical protein
MAAPTERQRYLMQFAGPQTHIKADKPHSFWMLSACGTSNLIRAYEYMRDAADRIPSRRELDAMIAAGWIELRRDDDHWTEDTRTGKRAYGHRIWLTEAGKIARDGLSV